jgi:phosphatidylserine/phosphatidylglycerophosphate/cardiolipin synthase-like enzyme
VIIDGRFAYLGSANWTGAGLGVKAEHRRNFELGMLIEDEHAIDDIQAHFDRIWRGAACRGCGHRSICEAPLDVSSATG